MTKWQKWLHTYYLWYTPTQWQNGVWNGGMVDWREWSNGENGRNGGNGRTAERMAERKWLYTYYLWYTPTPGIADWNGGMEDGMAKWRNGGWNGRMADGMAEWRNGGWNGGMVEWQEWLNGKNGGNDGNGGNGGNGGTAERMAE